MQWNLRMVAAQRDIWRCSDLRDALLEHGLDISTKKMLRLWSGQPISVRLDIVEALCHVLDCEPNDLILADDAVAVPKPVTATGRARNGAGTARAQKAFQPPRTARSANGAGEGRRAGVRSRDLLDVAPSRRRQTPG